MAAKKSEQKCQGELNFTSASFNALLALYDKNLQPPLPNARIFNTICEYAKSLKEVQNKEKDNDLVARLKHIADNKVKKLRNRKRDASKLEHLMKVKSQTDGIVEKVAMLEKAKRKVQQMNVLERMEVKYKEGPLSVLYNSIEKKAKLRVWTRKLKGLRGVCVGYLVAFDKHMNLAMMDVDEMFAIEEEVIVDPAEELKESLKRIERKKENKRKWRRKKRERLRQNEQKLMKNKGKVLSVEGIKEGSEILEAESVGRKCSSKNTGGESFDYRAELAENCSTPLLDSNTDDNEDSGRNDNLGETPTSTREVDLTEKKDTATNMDFPNLDLSTDNESCKVVMKDIDFAHAKLVQKQDELREIEMNKNDSRGDLENDLQRPECSTSDNEPSDNEPSDNEPSDIEIKKVSIDEEETGDSPSSFSEKNAPLIRNPLRDGADGNDHTREAFCSGEYKGGVELANEGSDTREISAREGERKDEIFGRETTSHQVTICDILNEVQGTETELKNAETLLPNDNNNDTHEYSASAVLQSNVLAMEFDEGSQDSTVFEGTVSRKRSALLETVTLHHTITYGMGKSVGVMKEPCEEVSVDDRKSDNDVDGRDGDNPEVGTAMSTVVEEANDSQVDLSDDDDTVDTVDNKEMVDSSMTKGSEGTVEDNKGMVKDNERIVEHNRDGTHEHNRGDKHVDDAFDVSGDNSASERTKINDAEDHRTKATAEELIKSTPDSQICHVLVITKQENIEGKELNLRMKDRSHDDCSDFKRDNNRQEKQFIHDPKAKSTIGSQSSHVRDIIKIENVDEKEEGELSSSDVEKSVEECEVFQKDIKKQEKAELEKASALKLHEKSRSSSKTTPKIKSDESTKRRRSISSTKESSCEINSKRTDKTVKEKSKSKLPEKRRKSLVDEDGRSRKGEDKVPVKSSITDLDKERRSERRSSRTDERKSSGHGLDSSTSTKHVGTEEPMNRYTRSSRKDKHIEKSESEKKQQSKGSGVKAGKEKTDQRKGRSSSESNLSSKEKLDDTQGTQVKTGRGSSQGLTRKENICKMSTRTSSSSRKDVKGNSEEKQSRGKDSKTIKKDSGTNSKGNDTKDKGGKSNDSMTSSDKMKMENISGKKEEGKTDLKENSEVGNKASEKNTAGRKSELTKRENSALKSRYQSSTDRNDSSLQKSDGDKSGKTGDKKCPPRKDSLKAGKSIKSDHLRNEKSKSDESKDGMKNTEAKSSSQSDNSGHSNKRIAKEIGNNVSWEKSSAKKKLSGERRSKLQDKETVGTVMKEGHRSTQSKTLKEKAGKSQTSASSNAEKLSGKRKRDVTPGRQRKTPKLDSKTNAVKTKEAKLPGNVVTVRILKVDRTRGKALVLKRRHVNQLFIRGDNVIMVAYDNLQATEVKI